MPAGESHTAPDPGSAAFGPRVRGLRLRAGLSQKQLADFSTLSVRAIRNIETGRVRSPRRDTLRLLLRNLDLDPQERDLLERLGSEGPDRAPSPSAVSHPGDLPAANGPLVGRHHEFDALMNLFVAERRRLITVTGIEGVGKTRLALEFARELHREGMRVLWVPLAEDAPLWRAHGGEAATLATQVRGFVRAGEQGTRRIRELIGDCDTLIALDGQRRSGGPTEAVTRLLAECPRLRILVTARGTVGRAAESLFPLGPLSVPDTGCDTDPTTLQQSASVRMFLLFMRQVRPDFRLDPGNAALVVSICRALDGLPAALERGARWSLVYSPQQLVQQLAVDPLTVVRPPDGAGWGAPPVFESVRQTMVSLTRRQRLLLSAMAQHVGCWSIAEAALSTGMSITECAKDIYNLLLHGLIRRRDNGDQSHFEALNIVRCIQRDQGRAFT